MFYDVVGLACFAAPRRDEKISGEMYSQSRFWETTSESQRHYMSGLYSHYDPTYMMQIQNSDNFNNLTKSRAPHVSAIGASSSSAVVAESRDEQMDGVQPLFIDFLGVGAT